LQYVHGEGCAVQPPNHVVASRLEPKGKIMEDCRPSGSRQIPGRRRRRRKHVKYLRFAGRPRRLVSQQQWFAEVSLLEPFGRIRDLYVLQVEDWIAVKAIHSRRTLVLLVINNSLHPTDCTSTWLASSGSSAGLR
jgi:hypothetical protein